MSQTYAPARPGTTGVVTSSDGTEIAYSSGGSGPALIVVDGALRHRRSHGRGRAMAESLSDRYHVYTYDRRGRGESGDTDRYSVSFEVDDLDALIDCAGGEAVVLGLESGAVLALEAAISGLAITGLVLLEPPFVVSDDRSPLSPDHRDRLELAIAEGRHGDAVAIHLVEAALMHAEAVASMRTQPAWLDLEAVAPTVAYDAAIMADTMSGNPDTLAVYAPVATQTLVLHGADTAPWLEAAATAIADVLPNAVRRQCVGAY